MALSPGWTVCGRFQAMSLIFINELPVGCQEAVHIHTNLVDIGHVETAARTIWMPKTKAKRLLQGVA